MANSGLDGKVMIGTATVATIDSWDSDIKEKLNIYDVFSSDWQQVLKGVKSCSGSFKGKWDYSDTTGQKVLADIIVGTTASVALKLYFTTTNYINITAFLSNAKIGNKHDGIVEVEFNFESHGAVTIA